MKFKELNFEKFVPDGRSREVTQYVKNLIPHGPRDYRPIPDLLAYSNPLPSRPYLLVTAEATNGEVSTISGTDRRLFNLTALNWQDISRGDADYTVGTWWDHAIWGNDLYVTNGVDWIQTVKLPGSVGRAEDLQTDVRGRYIAVVNDAFIMIGDTWDATDGQQPQRVRWSAINNPGEWTVGQNLSDQRDLRGEGGAIKGVVGGEYAIVLRERAWHRFTLTYDPDLVYQNDPIEAKVGTKAPRSIVPDGDQIYFLANDGFRRIVQGRYSEPIGEGMVDEMFFTNVDKNFIQEVQGISDVTGQLLLWFYATPNSALIGRPNEALVYNKVFKRWGRITKDVWMVGWNATPAVTLEELDPLYPPNGPGAGVDSIPGSLDDPVWAGGEFQLAAFDAAFRMGFFNGDLLECEIDTPEFGGYPRKIITRFVYPRAEASVVGVRLGTRDTKNLPVSWGPELFATLGEERVGYRTKGRYVRARLRMLDANDFQGADLEHTWGAKK